MRTDSDRLDLNSLLNMSAGSIVRALMGKDSLAAERVDKGGTACRTSRLGGALREDCMSRDVPVPEAPQTIKQNWIPFLTFFFRRIIFCFSPKVLAPGILN